MKFTKCMGIKGNEEILAVGFGSVEAYIWKKYDFISDWYCQVCLLFY